MWTCDIIGIIANMPAGFVFGGGLTGITVATALQQKCQPAVTTTISSADYKGEYMMKKKIVSIVLVIVLCISLMPTAVAADTPSVVVSPQSVMVDGVGQNFEVYNIDGSNYFKLRDIAYVLNGTDAQFSLTYDEAQKLISVTTGSSYTSVGGELAVGTDKSGTTVLSSQTIIINGTKSEIIAYNIGGNNFFQLRALGTALSFSADYDFASNTVLINSESSNIKTVLEAEAIYTKCSPAVFYIEVYNSNGTATGSGSGFFIDAKGTAVTNFHVIEGAESATITRADTGEKYDVLGVYDYSREEDWAVIKIKGSNFSYLTVGDASTVVGGATVYAIGSPLGLQNTISQGLISNPGRADNAVTYIQISAAISAGSSGGALINKYGEVIGITSASYVYGQNLNLALPISYIKNATTDSTISIAETNLSDPIAYLIDYATANGSMREVYGYDSYEIIMETDDAEYCVYYCPENDSLFLDLYYYASDGLGVFWQTYSFRVEKPQPLMRKIINTILNSNTIWMKRTGSLRVEIFQHQPLQKYQYHF